MVIVYIRRMGRGRIINCQDLHHTESINGTFCTEISQLMLQLVGYVLIIGIVSTRLYSNIVQVAFLKNGTAICF